MALFEISTALIVALVATVTDPVAQAAEPDPTTTAIQRWLPREARRAAFPRIVRALYEERGGGPLFHDGLVPNRAAHTLLRMVGELDAHGMDRGPYRLGYEPDDPQVHKRGLRKRQKRARKHLKPFALEPASSPKSVARKDARLASALVRYIVEMRYWKSAHPLTPSRGLGRLRYRHKDPIVATAARALENMEGELQALWPQTPKYGHMRDALARYRGLAQRRPQMPRMSWSKWKRASRKGEPSGAVVETLQARLAFEGHLRGPATGELDEATLAAVARYRAGHGMDEDGGVGWTLIRSMNTSMTRRVDALRVSLQRMRESTALRRGETTWARINIPAFTLTLYEDGQVSRTHRVIVGNTKLDFNRFDWKQGYLNRTPLLETRVTRVILNPAWIPPPRILDEEFEGEEKVVVKPGKDNPLGYVKFRLERTNAVFMHDTNKRRLFRKQKRAFSHGCIRIHDAMELAKHVAGQYAGITESDYQERLDRGKQDPIPLVKDLPVYVEYSTVDIDDRGEPVFYKDVYRYDRDYLKGDMPRNAVRFGSNKLRPKSVPAIPHDDYVRMKGEGQKAPMMWPPEAATEPSSEPDG